MSDITRILNSVEQGDPKAAQELLPLVNDALRRLAAQKMAEEAPDQTLQPAALVHEAGSGWGPMRNRSGEARGTLMAPPPRPCGGYSNGPAGA